MGTQNDSELLTTSNMIFIPIHTPPLMCFPNLVLGGDHNLGFPLYVTISFSLVSSC